MIPVMILLYEASVITSDWLTILAQHRCGYPMISLSIPVWVQLQDVNFGCAFLETAPGPPL